MPRVLGAALILVAMTWAPVAHAEQPQVPPVKLSAGGELDLSGHIGFLAGESAIPDLDSVIGRYFEPTTGVPNYGFVDGIYWFRVTLVNDTGVSQSRILEMSYPPIDEVRVFVPAPDGGYRESIAGDRVPFSKREIKHRHPLFSITVPAGQTYDVYLRISGESSLQLPLTLWERDNFIGHDNVRQLAVGAYYGVLLAMIAYHLILFFTVRDKSYLWFVAFVASYGWLSAQLDGVALQVLWGEAPVLNASLPLSVASSAYFAARYSRELLELSVHAPGWHRATLAFEWITIPSAILSVVLPYSIAIRIVLILSAGLLVTLIPASAIAWRRGARQARYYLLAWGAFFVGTAMMIANKFGLIPVTSVTDSSQQVGVVVEVFLFSIALADRINTIKAERAEAQTAALGAQRAAAENLKAEVDRQTHELREQAAQLKELDAQKTRFFQNVSHELRTPLTLILTPLEQLAATSPDRRIQMATQNARRLLRLVNQLLEFQKLAAGKRDIDSQPVDLADLARRCGNYIQPTCEQRDISFQYHIDVPIDQRPVVLAEVDSVEKILFNYLSNALKFAPRGGTISLTVQAGDGVARVTVADNGPGIPEHQRARLFQVFSQLDNQADAKIPGTGLGLALARELAEAMGGEVGVASEPGAGSSFWFQLPLAASAQLSDEDELTGDFGGPAEHPEITSLTIDREPVTTPLDRAPSEQPAADGATILVVDDIADMRALLRSTLEAHGFQVRAARSAFDALRLAQAEPPSLIITDWMMPGMSGPELVQTAREQPELAGIPIVLLTARSDEESKLLATDIGADAFLGKPFNEPELLSTVGNLLRLKDSERQVRDLNRHLTENVLKRYLPESVVESILAGETSIDGPPEKYTATVLFADLVGFTEMTRRLRVAKMSRLLNDYLGEMCEAVFLHDGTVDKFIGDAVMAVFGAPVKADPRVQVERAIAAAHSMQEALVRITAEWEREGVGALSMRIGIHQGPLVMGNFGNERRSDFTAIGPTVNMAARLQSSCPPGQVLVSGEVYDYLPENAAEPAGEFELQGIGTVLLYRLVSAPRATLRDMREALDRG